MAQWRAPALRAPRSAAPAMAAAPHRPADGPRRRAPPTGPAARRPAWDSGGRGTRTRDRRREASARHALDLGNRFAPSGRGSVVLFIRVSVTGEATVGV